MSYDIWLEMDAGGPEPVGVGDLSWNYTSNMAGAWRAAGADLAKYHGKLAGDCVASLDGAIADMKLRPGDYRQFEPENGWGSLETLIPALEELAAEFRRHPKATVVVWR